MRLMPKRMTRAERSEDTRQRLLEAARAVFVERGFQGATLELVSEAAGFTKGAVYSQFENKADLFLALLEQRFDQRVREIEETGKLVKDPTAATILLNRQWRESAQADIDWQLLVLEFRVHVARNPELRARYAAQQARLREAFVGVLKTDFDAMGVRPPVPTGDIARVLFAMATGALLARVAEGDEFPDELIERAAVALLHELTTQPKPATKSAKPRRLQHSSGKRTQRT